MATTDIYKRRFAELAEQLAAVEATKHIGNSALIGAAEHVDDNALLNWRVKAKNLVGQACGTESEHYLALVQAEKGSPYSTNYSICQKMRAVFEAAQEDFEGGYLVELRNLIHAEIADSELDQARELLKAGYYVAAAVIAGVVLETSLRAQCEQHGIPTGKLDKMNADLAKAGQYNKLVQKQITMLADIRNNAAHGKTTSSRPMT